MPWKTIGYILIALIVILFIAFNLDNTSDISFIFFSVSDVPVFFTVFLSVIIGCLIMLPITLSRGSVKKKKKKSEEDDLSIDALLSDDNHDITDGIKPAKEKKSRFRRKKKEDLFGDSESISDLDIRK